MPTVKIQLKINYYYLDLLVYRNIKQTTFARTNWGYKRNIQSEATTDSQNKLLAMKQTNFKILHGVKQHLSARNNRFDLLREGIENLIYFSQIKTFRTYFQLRRIPFLNFLAAWKYPYKCKILGDSNSFLHLTQYLG